MERLNLCRKLENSLRQFLHFQHDVLDIPLLIFDSPYGRYLTS